MLPKTLDLKKYMEEKAAIVENFDFLQCRISTKGLICTGVISAEFLFNDYQIEIRYDLQKYPSVFIVNPNIEFNSEIHMYPDNSLCLHYPKDKTFTTKSKLFNTIIPWTSEWLVFYEVYKLKGKWLGDYKAH